MGDSEVKEWDGEESAQVKLRVDYRDGGNEVRPLRIPLPCLLSFLCLLPHTTLNTHTFSSCCATTCAHASASITSLLLRGSIVSLLGYCRQFYRTNMACHLLLPNYMRTRGFEACGFEKQPRPK